MPSNNIFIVDSHCHLNYDGLNHRVDEVIANAHAAGIGLMQTICTKLTEFEDIYKIAQANPSVYASVGIHPHEADNQKASLETLLDYAARPKTIGIGETGLDYFYENSAPSQQQESFKIHMQAASQTNLPIIIHTRDAEDDTYKMLKDFIDGKPLNEICPLVIASDHRERGNPENSADKNWIASSQEAPRKDGKRNLKGLLHCFTGTADLAQKALDMGLYISISGIVTFKSANDLRDVVKNVIPMDRLLVETDSPFLAPIPFRGKTCEPAYTRNTAEFIAELKGISLEELASKTTENFLRLFDKVKV
jgi:TatD DNase family protein